MGIDDEDIDCFKIKLSIFCKVMWIVVGFVFLVLKFFVKGKDRVFIRRLFVWVEVLIFYFGYEFLRVDKGCSYDKNCVKYCFIIDYFN